MSTLAPDLPAPQIPPYKSRRGWLIAFGVADILLACFFLALIALFLFLPAPPPGASPQQPVSPAAMKAFFSLIYGAVAIVFVVLGVGSIRCKNWARIASLVVSGFWLTIGLLSTLMFLLVFPSVMRQDTQGSPEIRRMAFVFAVTVMGFIFVLLPSVFLFFYSRKSVRATCLAAAQEAPKKQAPVPVMILAIWEGLGVFSIFSFVMVRATVVFGVVLHGWPAFLALATVAGLSAIAAGLIWRQEFAGWALALGKALFWGASTGVSFALHDMASLNREMGMGNADMQLLPQIQSIMLVFVAFTMGAYLIFLMYTRKYFPRSSDPAPQIS